MSDLPTAPTLADQIVEIEKTIRDCGRRWPEQVAKGYMTEAVVESRLEILRRVHTQLMWLDANPWALAMAAAMADAVGAGPAGLAGERAEITAQTAENARRFPILIERGRLTVATAQRKQAAMAAVLHTVTWLARNTEWIREEAAKRARDEREDLANHPAARMVLDAFPGATVRAASKIMWGPSDGGL